MEKFISIPISIKPDEDGFVGRQCPSKGCCGYFKIQFGTGLKGEDLPCHCPYCGHKDNQGAFLTEDQEKYVHSHAIRHIEGELSKIFKSFERRPRPGAVFDISITCKEGRPHPIHYYREKKLEQEVVCEGCTLRYSIYGVFGYCPDCGSHNSLQILKANFAIVEKMLVLAETFEQAIKEKLIEDALENAVSAMDGYGRELCKLFANKSSDPARAGNLSFQNISGAQTNLLQLFSLDIAAAISSQEWVEVKKCFQKRHLLAHKMGVIDQAYIDQTGEGQSLDGRKVVVGSQEVRDLVGHLVNVGQYLYQRLHSLK